MSYFTFYRHVLHIIETHTAHISKTHTTNILPTHTTHIPLTQTSTFHWLKLIIFQRLIPHTFWWLKPHTFHWLKPHPLHRYLPLTYHRLQIVWRNFLVCLSLVITNNLIHFTTTWHWHFGSGWLTCRNIHSCDSRTVKQILMTHYCKRRVLGCSHHKIWQFPNFHLDRNFQGGLFLLYVTFCYMWSFSSDSSLRNDVIKLALRDVTIAYIVPSKWKEK